MKATKASIDSFLSIRKVAIAGVSRNPKKFGHIVFKQLMEKGFEVYPINRDTDNITGIPCFHSVSALPLNVHSLVIITPKKHTRDIVAEAISKGIDNIWIQQMSDTPEAIELTRSHPVNLITRECILMHTDPVTGIHKFHRNIKKLFGLYPR
ncbi:MAG: CoA-binding protein [Bacteroidales bacterium]|nr:CoA-binding protein [Bacteroidales bacterium]